MTSHHHEKKGKEMSPFINFASKLCAGSVAGVCGVVATFPLDLAKTRLQNVQSSGAGIQYKGIADVLSKVYSERGFFGLYNGSLANLIGIIPEKAIKLACNDQFRDMLRNESGIVTMSGELMAGIGAGFCQVVVTTPMERVKIQCQMDTSKGVAQVVKELGLKGIYRGYTPTLVRDVWFSAVFFPMQSKLKASLVKPEDTGLKKTLYSFLAGVTAGGFSAAISTPLDVIKTRIQTKEPGNFIEVASRIAQNEGYGAFWKGIKPRVIAIGPLFGIAIMVYDIQKRTLRSFGYYVPEN